jgi:hypothetical protein
MPDTQSVRSRFIRAPSAKRLRDTNLIGAKGEPDERMLDRTADNRTRYRFGFKRRLRARPRIDPVEVIPKVDQAPSLEQRETRLAAWLEAMLEYEIEKNR